MMPQRLALVLSSILVLWPAHAIASTLAPRTQALLAHSSAWEPRTVVAVGKVREGATELESAANILAVYLDLDGSPTLRVSLVAPFGIRDRKDWFDSGSVGVIALLDEGPGGNDRLPDPLSGPAPFAWDRMVLLQGGASLTTLTGRSTTALSQLPSERVAAHLDEGWLAAALDGASSAAPTRIAVYTWAGGRVLDRLVAPVSANTALAPTGQTNVAFVHHANQGLAFTDFFKGRFGAEATSGYDEILRVHEQYNIPGNFHLAVLLQTVAEWNKQNGDALDFNGWLRTGITNGWASMLCSAYGQPIMPFVQGGMNDWAISRDHDMVNTRFGYNPHVAWVPERVFLDPGTYPNAGVIDWSGAHWQANGVNGVILDDWPHCANHNKHQIHFLTGNGLRMIPRDGDFTGKLHTGDGAGALAILTNEANSGVGQYRITVYGDDWEQAAGVAGWENTFPFGLSTYQWMIQKCSVESAWLHTWKLDPALANPDFNGDTFTPTYGTYGGIGDLQGYGGNNNAWYTDWAGYIPYSTGGNGSGGCGGTGNCKNHGQLWNDAYAALQAAPNNGIREAGWYVLMTNLHETAWHDYLGGPISGWQRQYAAHIKNANVYAEAARWAGGLYGSATGCFLSDIDNDGVNELVIHNDRVFAVFESIGGRCTQLFAKGSGYAYSVIGIDNAYWAGTEGDYNDVNHVAGLSDVGPNLQHDLYAINVDVASGNTVKATFTASGVRKTVSLTVAQPYLSCVYRVGANTQYIQSGFTPDLVDELYNARMERVWGGGNSTYMGYRNPNTAATGAYVLGAGGGTFNLTNTSTLMKVDEIRGTQKFQFYLYAGATSALTGGGQTAELDALVTGLTDALPPEAVGGTYYPATRQLVLNFDEPVQASTIAPASIRLDANNDGTPDVTLDGGTVVLTTGNASTITLQVSTAVHNAIQALPNKNQIRLLLLAAAVRDVANNANAVLTNAGNVFVSYGPATLITLDGRFDTAEWPACVVTVLDTLDSGWNAGPGNVTNEIQALYATWDSTYLYLGIRGVVTANSWLLYLDTDPGGGNGQTNLTAIDAWERGATFSAPGFRPDWEFGAYQHQGAFDSQSFFKILSATTTANYTDSILKAFDPNHNFALNGGSEIAIPWNVLYGLGVNHVPANAQLGMVASLCWDPEPAGELGGDQAPNNLGATPPAIDNRRLITLDGNGDGIPDPIDRTPPSLLTAAPTGYDSVLTINFNEPVTTASANQASHYAIYETANPSNVVPVVTATLQPNQTTVVLKVSGMGYRGYTVVASLIADRSCFANVQPQTSAAFFGLPVSVDEPLGAPLALRSITPNPTNGGALITYSVPRDGVVVTVDLYDLSGRVVRNLGRGPHVAGLTTRSFDGRDARGVRLAPGLYFVRLSRGTEVQVKRFVVVP